MKNGILIFLFFLFLIIENSLFSQDSLNQIYFKNLFNELTKDSNINDIKFRYC
jgi:hypothetical protein